MRWPADERAVYAPDHSYDSEAVPDLTVGVPEDGKSAEIRSDILDPTSKGDGFMLKLSATPAAASLAAPCDVLQIRYITADHEDDARRGIVVGVRLATDMYWPSHGRHSRIPR